MDTLVKQPSESRLFSMDFAALLARGETVSSVSSVSITPTTSSPLSTSGAAAVSGTSAQQRLTGGLAGTRYKVTFVVVTSLSNTLEGEGYLHVKDL